MYWCVQSLLIMEKERSLKHFSKWALMMSWLRWIVSQHTAMAKTPQSLPPFCRWKSCFISIFACLPTNCNRRSFVVLLIWVNTESYITVCSNSSPIVGRTVDATIQWSPRSWTICKALCPWDDCCRDKVSVESRPPRERNCKQSWYDYRSTCHLTQGSVCPSVLKTLSFYIHCFSTSPESFSWLFPMLHSLSSWEGLSELWIVWQQLALKNNVSTSHSC